MARYILKRFFYILVVFLILSFLLFLIYNMLPIDKAAAQAKEEVKLTKGTQTYEELYQLWSERYGTNGTKLERYGRWIGIYPYADGSFKGMLQGNFGDSNVYGKPVAEIIVEPMKNTILINIFATIFALGITIPLGIFCAVRRGSKSDVAIQVGTIIGYSLPTFIIAIVFIWLFAVILGWFPVSGTQTVGYQDWPAAKQFWDKMYHFALPLIIMTFCSLGGMTRYVRASMIEALSMDCIKTARAKGLKEKTVIYSHAWRNALIPIVTLVIGWFLGIFSGSLMIENIFGINGIGKVYFSALSNNDNEVVLALQMFYIFISLLGNLVIDIAYGFVDPRIRVNK